MTTKALAEVERALKRAARSVRASKAAERARYMRPALPMLGLTVPQQRDVFKRGFSFSAHSPDEQYPLWDYIWRNARTHEGKMQPVFFVRSLKPTPEPAEFSAFWDFARRFADDINAWDHSDELSKTYSFLLEARPATIYPQLVAWNTDADPWKRRQSVVSLFCYAALHKRHPPATKVFPLLKRLLEDEDYYVQKGVGWTLREAYNVYPEKAFAFVLKHAGVIRPAAFSPALEKMTGSEKAEIKARRKRDRRF